MAAPLVPIAIGAAALLGLLYLGGSAKAAKPKPPVEDSAKTKAARDAGYAAGIARAAADVAAGQPEDLNPLAPAADAKASGNAAAYQAGFHDGYVDGIAAAAAAAKIKKESVPGSSTTPAWRPPGPASGLPGAMREGETAMEYGYRRGRNKGTEDCEGGYEENAHSYYSGTNFKARAAESGDAASYKQGWDNGYEFGYRRCQAEKIVDIFSPAAGVGRTSAGGVVTGFANAIGGALSSVGVGAMAPRMMVSAPRAVAPVATAVTEEYWKKGEAAGYAECKRYLVAMREAAKSGYGIVLPPLEPMTTGDALGRAYVAGWKVGRARCMGEPVVLTQKDLKFPPGSEVEMIVRSAPPNMMMAARTPVRTSIRTTGGLGAIAVPIQRHVAHGGRPSNVLYRSY